jgi:hypothetical protein
LIQIKLSHILGGFFIDASRLIDFYGKKNNSLKEIINWILDFRTPHPVESLFETIILIENIFNNQVSDEYVQINI